MILEKAKFLVRVDIENIYECEPKNRRVNDDLVAFVGVWEVVRVLSVVTILKLHTS